MSVLADTRSRYQEIRDVLFEILSRDEATDYGTQAVY